MKKNLFVISDFTEGMPVVASVRYSEIMEILVNKFNLVVLSNGLYGTGKSAYAERNFIFKTMEAPISSKLDNNRNNKGQLDKLIRRPFFLKLWRNLKHSKMAFQFKNLKLIKEIISYIGNNEISCILVTVPDIYGLYIVDLIRKRNSNIPILVEIRDIINHSIGEGNPKYIYSKAENLLIENADEIIALSNGIREHYKSLMEVRKISKKINVIKNGYDFNKFEHCLFNEKLSSKNHIVFSHVGSIYKGRNILDFLKALEMFSRQTNKSITFNIVGILDKEAKHELNDFSTSRVNLNILGPKSHNEAIDILKRSDIAVILTHVKGSEYAIPGKTFEYIGACKPIIAVTEDGELTKLIERRYGECASHNPKNIVDKLNILINTKYDFSDRKKFSREEQANNIIKTIEKLTN